MYCCYHCSYFVIRIAIIIYYHYYYQSHYYYYYYYYCYITFINITLLLLYYYYCCYYYFFLLLVLSSLASLSHLLPFGLRLLKMSFLFFRSSHREDLGNIFAWNKHKTCNKRQKLLHLDVGGGLHPPLLPTKLSKGIADSLLT